MDETTISSMDISVIIESITCPITGDIMSDQFREMMDRLMSAQPLFKLLVLDKNLQLLVLQ